jgi:alpha-N-acetylglucosamine transferase
MKNQEQKTESKKTKILSERSMDFHSVTNLRKVGAEQLELQQIFVNKLLERLNSRALIQNPLESMFARLTAWETTEAAAIKGFSANPSMIQWPVQFYSG